MGAVAAYRQAIQLDPSFIQAHHSLAVVLGEQGQSEAAIEHYRQVIALQPCAVKAYNNIGCILVGQGQVEAGLEIYQQALALQPDWAVLHDNYGKAIEAQDPTAAVKAYRRAIQLQPDLVSARYNLAQVLLLQGQSVAAIEEFEHLLRLEPCHAAAHTACGLVYIGLGQWQQAFSHFRQVLLPQQPLIHAFCDWADQLTGEDELSLARKACSQFLQALLHHTEVAPFKARLSKFSLLKVALGDVSRTLQESSQQNAGAVTQPQLIQSTLAETYLRLGNLLMRYGGAKQLQQAEIYYQHALKLQPQSPELYLSLVQCLGQQGRWNAALILNRLALTVHPDAVSLYRSIGYVLEQQQRWSEAISYYQQALAIGDCSKHRDWGENRQALQTQPPIQALHQSLKSDGLNALSQANSAGSPSLEIDVKGICASTSSWIRSKQLAHYVSLTVDVNHTLVQSTAPAVAIDASTSTSTTIATSDSANCSNCDGLNCYRCLKEIFAQFEPIHLGRGSYTLQPQKSTVAPPPYFVARLPYAHAWSSPYQTPWMVANSVAILTSDHYLLGDVSREYPGHLPGCRHPQPTFERILQQRTEAEQITGQVAALAGLSGHNYFHWMVDILPRFELLQRSGIDLASVDWFWINSPDACFQRETLNCLGIPDQKILASDRHPHIQAEQLIVPSFAGHLGWLEPWALTFLRQQFLPIASTQMQQPERIYITRSSAHHRRLLNEAAVLNYLDTLGFVSVELESLSLSEQIALFAQAKVIVAPHGGGLTNTIFCTPGTTVIELFAPNYIRHYYWVISQQLRLRHYFIKGSAIACTPVQNLMYPSPLMEDIWIDLEALQATLQQLGLR